MAKKKSKDTEISEEEIIREGEAVGAFSHEEAEEILEEDTKKDRKGRGRSEEAMNEKAAAQADADKPADDEADVNPPQPHGKRRIVKGPPKFEQAGSNNMSREEISEEDPDQAS